MFCHQNKTVNGRMPMLEFSKNFLRNFIVVVVLVVIVVVVVVIIVVVIAVIGIARLKRQSRPDIVLAPVCKCARYWLGLLCLLKRLSSIVSKSSAGFELSVATQFVPKEYLTKTRLKYLVAFLQRLIILV